MRILQTQLLIFLVALLPLTMLSSSCYRNDTRVIKVGVEGLSSDECAEAISNQLNRVAHRGLNPQQRIFHFEMVGHDLNTQTVEIKYNALLASQRNIETHLQEMGFNVKTDRYTLSATPKMKEKLPSACK